MPNRLFTFGVSDSLGDAHVLQEPGVRARAACGAQPTTYWKRLWIEHVSEPKNLDVCAACRSHIDTALARRPTPSPAPPTGHP